MLSVCTSLSEVCVGHAIVGMMDADSKASRKFETENIRK